MTTVLTILEEGSKKEMGSRQADRQTREDWEKSFEQGTGKRVMFISVLE